MPRIHVQTPASMSYEICTRRQETLKAWFDEVLPFSYLDGPGRTLWARVNIWPMWAWELSPPAEPDWLTDSRVLGRLIEFRAKDGKTGLEELARIRRELEQELATFDRR